MGADPYAASAASARTDMRGTSGVATSERLLAAAEALFSERGFAATSMRAVTHAAGVSVSAANYHFGSKLELLRAVCERQLGPINEERMRSLDELDARCAPAAPDVEAILHAFLRPAVLPTGVRSEDLREVASRLYADPPEVVAELKQRLFGPVMQRTIESLVRALPESSAESVRLAFQMSVGTMVHVVAGHLDTTVGLSSPYPRDEKLLDFMVAYCSGGFRASLAVASRLDTPAPPGGTP